MEFPFGHHHHHHHERREDEEEEDQYPPPGRLEPTFSPPRGPPPQSDFDYPGDYPPPPPHNRFDSDPDYPSVHHVSHRIHHQEEFDPVPSDEFRPETHRHRYDHQSDDSSASELLNKPSSRVFCKVETGYSLTIRDGNVILARSDEDDPFQHWIKDERYSTRVKDEEGFPSFSLVNKATGEAVKHSIGATHPVQLIRYNPDVLDESILWTESRDLGDGFRTIRMVNNIRLNMDAFHGDQNHGGVHDGTTIVLWEWKKGDNQRWNIVPYCKYFALPNK